MNDHYKIRITSVILGIILLAITTFLYLIKNPFWYFTGVFVAWFLFDNSSHLSGNKTTLDLLIKKRYKNFFIYYILLLFFSILIEVIGSLTLKLWSFPKLWSLEPLGFLLLMNGLGYLLYPIILMSFRELYYSIKSQLKNKLISLFFSVIVSVLVWEVPTIYSQDWVYKIPFINWKIFNINIVVIIGTSILILGPIYIYNLASKISKQK